MQIMERAGAPPPTNEWQSYFLHGYKGAAFVIELGMSWNFVVPIFILVGVIPTSLKFTYAK